MSTVQGENKGESPHAERERPECALVWTGRLEIACTPFPPDDDDARSQPLGSLAATLRVRQAIWQAGPRAEVGMTHLGFGRDSVMAHDPRYVHDITIDSV